MSHQFIHAPTPRRLEKRGFIAFTLAFTILCALSAGGCSKSADASDREKRPDYPSTLSGGAPCGSCIAPASIFWKTIIQPAQEPGESLIISGKIYQSDGVTPAEGVVLFVYHTDVTGYYNKDDDASHPRLRGWMQTGADGKYEFRTIKPGAYPHRSTPAHIHAHVYGPGYSERSIEDYWFEGDPRINEKELKNASDQGGHPFVVVVALKRDSDGVWRGVRDIKLAPPK
ncbi:MAG: protocatechuate 3,4-dioxygenase [Chthoniobacterales bacterium]